MRVLVISDRLPYPAIGGTEQRLGGLLRYIGMQNEVWYTGFVDRPEKTAGLPLMQEFCRRVETVGWRRRARVAHVPRLVQYGLRAWPLELAVYHSHELVRKVRQLTDSAKVDVVEIVGSNMALYLESLPQDLHCKSLLTFIDIQFEKANRFRHVADSAARKMRAWLHSRMMRRWEPRYAEKFGWCVAMSEVDRQLLMAANPHLRIRVIPNGVDARAYQPLPLNSAGHSLLFIGSMSYAPNVDAVLHFCKTILPLIRRKLPDIELTIVGSHPPPSVCELGRQPNIQVLGYVEDVVPYYLRSRASVVPLRAGGGTRLKILESMALGRPVVSTSLGCEGLEMLDGEHLLIADEPSQFTDQVVRLFEDQDLYESVSRQARCLVETQYDWSVIAQKLLAVYAELAGVEHKSKD